MKMQKKNAASNTLPALKLLCAAVLAATAGLAGATVVQPPVTIKTLTPPIPSPTPAAPPANTPSDGYAKTGYLAPAIIGPTGCPTGWIGVPSMRIPSAADSNSNVAVPSFCVMPFPAVNNGGGTAATATTTNAWSEAVPWTNINRDDAIVACSSVKDRAGNHVAGAHLMRESEWLAIAHNMAAVAANWDDGKVVMAGGRNNLFAGLRDSSVREAQPASYQPTGSQQRGKQLSTGDTVYDIGGNIYQWTYLDDSLGGVGGLFPNQNYSVALVAAPFASMTRGMGWFGTPENWSGYAPIRGGSWNAGTGAGPFDLSYLPPGFTNPLFGFRCAK